MPEIVRKMSTQPELAQLRDETQPAQMITSTNACPVCQEPEECPPCPECIDCKKYAHLCPGCPECSNIWKYISIILGILLVLGMMFIFFRTSSRRY